MCFMVSIIRLTVSAALLSLAIISGGFLRGGSGGGQVLPPSFTAAWGNFSLGAGGNAYGIKIYPDGTQLIQNDTYGGHIFKSAGTCVGSNNQTLAAPCWQQLVTATSLPAAAVDYTLLGSGNLGTAELVACASNTDVLYMIYTNKVYVSTNRGANWVDANKTITIAGNNGPFNRPRMACDPNNPDVIYAASPSSGTFVSTNGRSGLSASWTTIAAVGNGSSGEGATIAIDPSSAFSGGLTQRLMICTYGTGCYISTNGGSSYALTTSGPSTGSGTFVHIVDKFGQFWVANGSSNVFRYATTTWSTLPSGNNLTSIAADPNSASSGANHLAGINNFAGQIIVSTDNGASWQNTTNNPGQAASSPQPIWMAGANQQSGGLPFFSGITIAYDNSSNLWMGAGLGAWITPAPTSGSSTIWTANTIGIEQLVTNQIISPPGIGPLAGVWDKGFMLLKVPDVYASTYFNTSSTANCGLANCSPITGGWGIDYVAGSQFVTGVQRSNLDSSYSPASSSNGGVTWTRWAGLPSSPDVGGSIAASTSTNWLVVPGQNTALQYTTNGGASWSASTAAANNGWITNYVNNRQPVAADRVTAGTFYAVDLGTGSIGSQKFYRSTDNGANFTSLGTPFSADVAVYNDAVITPPTLGSVNTAGHVFYVPGFQSGPTIGHLWKSTNGGTSFTCLTATGAGCSGAILSNVAAAGFGFPKIGGGGYPMIYAIGLLNSVYGVYASADAGATFAAINVPASQQVWPGNSVDLPTGVAGDSDIYGRINVGFRGSAGAYIDLADACPWVGFTNIVPNQALTGASVTISAQHSGLVPVTGVAFYIDGVQIGATQTGQTTYSVSLNASGQTPGAHTLKVQAAGNGCTLGGTGNAKSIPITTS